MLDRHPYLHNNSDSLVNTSIFEVNAIQNKYLWTENSKNNSANYAMVL